MCRLLCTHLDLRMWNITVVWCTHGFLVLKCCVCFLVYPASVKLLFAAAAIHTKLSYLCESTNYSYFKRSASVSHCNSMCANILFVMYVQTNVGAFRCRKVLAKVFGMSLTVSLEKHNLLARFLAGINSSISTETAVDRIPNDVANSNGSWN